METRSPSTDGHDDAITVTTCAGGWEVRQTRDSAVVRLQRYSDWHRVERAVQVFEWRTGQPVSYSTKR